MNYRAELKGWCLDRAIRICEVNGSKPEMAEIMKMAESLADYAYVPNKDMHDTADYLFGLVRNAAPGEAKIAELMAALERIQNDRYSQRIDKLDEPAEETVQ